MQQKTETHIYVVMAYCAAGDLAQYMQDVRTRIKPGALPQDQVQRRSGPPPTDESLYPHPREGGLNETVVRSFLGQLS